MGGARDALDRVPAPCGQARRPPQWSIVVVLTTANAPSWWLGWPGTGPGAGTGDAGVASDAEVTGEACSWRAAGERPPARRPAARPLGRAPSAKRHRLLSRVWERYAV